MDFRNKKMVKITTKRQFECLVELMENNVDIARASCRDKDSAKSRWNNFAVELNMFGPPIRDGNGWSKVWTDLKFKLKKKTAESKGESTSNGYASIIPISFTPVERRAVRILNLDPIFSALDNESDSEIFYRDAPAYPNFYDIKIEEEEATEPDTNIPSSSSQQTTTPCSKTPGKLKTDAIFERLPLQTKQTDLQEELVEYTKKIYNLKKENLEFKKEMLRLMKEKNEMYRAEIKHKQQCREERLKVERERLMLEKQQLGLNFEEPKTI